MKEWDQYLFDLEAMQQTWDKVKQDDSKFYQKDFLPKHMIKKSPKAIQPRKMETEFDFAERRVSLKSNGELKKVINKLASDSN